MADEATSTYTNSKEFAYDLVRHDRIVPVKKGTDTWLNIWLNYQRRSLKGILLLFINPVDSQVARKQQEVANSEAANSEAADSESAE